MLGSALYPLSYTTSLKTGVFLSPATHQVLEQVLWLNPEFQSQCATGEQVEGQGSDGGTSHAFPLLRANMP